MLQGLWWMLKRTERSLYVFSMFPTKLTSQLLRLCLPWLSKLLMSLYGSQRLYIDYRGLNEATVKDAVPIPRVDDSLASLSSSRWFSTLDLDSGYWQVAMDANTQEKAAFVTPSGLYEWNVMPFGLCNAPSTFARLMELVLKGLHWKMCLIYLDDVIVIGRTFEEGLERP